MPLSEILPRIFAVVSGYLLGSVPFAYIFTRVISGKDIRRLGSGNAGANNVYREVGLKAAIPVGILDIAKGTAAVFLASRLIDISPREPNIFVLLAGLAAIAGHIWPVYLKLQGGNGLSPTVGTLLILMPRELLIAIALLLIFFAFTHNLILSANLGLLSVPVSAWFFDSSWLFIAYSLAAAIIMAGHFFRKRKKPGAGRG